MEKVEIASAKRCKRSEKIEAERVVRRSGYKSQAILYSSSITSSSLSLLFPPSLSLYLLINQLRRSGVTKEDPRFSNRLSPPPGIIHLAERKVK